MLSRPTGPSSGGDRTRMGNRRGRRRHAATSVRRSGSNFLGGRCKSPCVAWGSNDAGLPGKAYDQSTESTHRFPVACEAPLLAGLCLAMGEPRTASQDELFARRLPLSCEAPLGRDRPRADIRESLLADSAAPPSDRSQEPNSVRGMVLPCDSDPQVDTTFAGGHQCRHFGSHVAMKAS